jgi:hypothetical protein
LLGALECGEAAMNEKLIPASAVLMEEEHGLAGWANTRGGTRCLDFHESDETVNLGLFGDEFCKDAAKAERVFAECGAH